MRNESLSRQEEAEVIVETIARWLRDEGLEVSHIEGCLRHLQEQFPGLQQACEREVKRSRYLGSSL